MVSICVRAHLDIHNAVICKESVEMFNKFTCSVPSVVYNYYNI